MKLIILNNFETLIVLNFISIYLNGFFTLLNIHLIIYSDLIKAFFMNLIMMMIFIAFIYYLLLKAVSFMLKSEQLICFLIGLLFAILFMVIVDKVNQ
jgi:hypothetical protein